MGRIQRISCNCIDEDGNTLVTNQPPDMVAGSTFITVEGDEFEAVHNDRRDIIIEREAMENCLGNDVAIYQGKSSYLYYNGIRALNLDRETLFTYNILSYLELTEDRTIKYAYIAHSQIAKWVLRCENADVIKDILLARPSSFEGKLDYSSWSVQPSEIFLSVVDSLVANKISQVNQSAVAAWKTATNKSVKLAEIDLNTLQRKSLDKAIAFCIHHGFRVNEYDIKIVESLGSGTHGLAYEDQIFIAEGAFYAGGAKYLASTLIEEFIHLRNGYNDCTREMQTYLFDRLVSALEIIQGESL